MEPAERVRKLLAAANEYAAEVSNTYDEVADQIAARVAQTGSLGKLELGALCAWKRLRADTPWMAQLMSTPDHQVSSLTKFPGAALR
ncbi:hypothetical protein AB0H83_44165 [Dactylosporangium sp. NPDC050688]|uniref:hypothetical protein n=1 Tax=Dactylosporangium sp. NPDC050688 TaxID=3157217 RepID=UPI0033F127B7